MKKRTVFGLPLNPVRHLAEIDGASFCVSYATRDKLGGQLELFDRGPAAPAAGKWTAHRGPWGRNLTWTRGDMPGLTIRHCGHPTAHYPYYITLGDSMELAAPGTFRNLAPCMAAAVEFWTTINHQAGAPTHAA